MMSTTFDVVLIFGFSRIPEKKKIKRFLYKFKNRTTSNPISRYISKRIKITILALFTVTKHRTT
jgi:hypothetical protein